MVHDIATLETAGPEDLCIFSDIKFRDACENCGARVFVTSRKLAQLLPGRPVLLVDQPRLAAAQISLLFYPPVPFEAGIAAGAHVDPTAKIGEGSRIDCGAAIGRDVTVGARCHIGPCAVIGHGVSIADDCRIGAIAAISYARIGSRVKIGTGVSIGGEGFGFVPSPTGLMRMSQLGRVIIEDDVEIGENSAVDRGALGDTVIGAGTKIDNLVHIAHNVRIGRHCIITAQVGIAGSSVVGDQTMIGGQTAIKDHITIGARVKIVPQSGIIRDISDGETVGGSPGQPIRDWQRQIVALAQLTKRKPPEPH